jgi:hypothetical protein
MPVVDFLEPQPPTRVVNATDKDVVWAGPWPSSSRTEQVAYDLTGLTLERASIATAPVKLRRSAQPPGLVVKGGTIHHRPTLTDPAGTPREPTWPEWHKNYGVIVETDQATIVGTKVYSVGDAFQMAGGADWRLFRCWASHIYDDAVEDDWKRGGLIDSCVFDGVHLFASSESIRRPVDPDPVVRIRNTMVRLRPQYDSFDPTRFGHNQHGPFFKWDPDSPRLDIRDSIFRADTPSSYGRLLDLPPGSTGANVVLIGTETWSDMEIHSWRSQIENVRLLSADAWDNALKYRATRPLPQGDIL